MRAGRLPVAPHKPGFDQDAWSLLQTMLIEERRLIEFLTGPKTRVDSTTKLVVNVQPDDICTNCFTTATDPAWVMAPTPRNILRPRATRINQRIAHFSWILVGPDTRVDTGFWRTGYLRLVVEQFESFTDWLMARQPLATEPLLDAVVVAAEAAQHLPAEVELSS